jgi:hypothetical protein
MKFNLNEDGSKYMRFIAWNQIWLRSSQMNPGTMIAGKRQQLEPILATDVCVFWLIPNFLKIHDCYPLWYKQPLLMVELQGVLEQRYGAGKKPGLFSRCME